MRRSLILLLAVLLGLSLIGVGALLGSKPVHAQGAPVSGSGMWIACQTAAQVKELARLRNGNSSWVAALETVNVAAPLTGKYACLVGKIHFQLGTAIMRVLIDNHVFEIYNVEIDHIFENGFWKPAAIRAYSLVPLRAQGI